MLPDQFLSGRFERENGGDCCGPVRSGGNLSGGCFEYKAADVGAFVATKNVPLITIVAAEATRFYQHRRMVLLQTGHSRWSKSEIMDRQIHEIGWDSLTSDRFVEGYYQFIRERSRELPEDDFALENRPRR